MTNKLLFSTLPDTPNHSQQGELLRSAMHHFKWTRSDLSTALGCSPRTLDKWLLPRDSGDFRKMGKAYYELFTSLCEREEARSSMPTTLLPDNTVLGMSLAIKAFQLIQQDSFKVSANLSAADVEGLANFGKFQSMLVMAYNEGHNANKKVSENA